MLHTRDGTERDVWEAVRMEAAVVIDELQLNLARHIVKEYAEAQNRGEKKS